MTTLQLTRHAAQQPCARINYAGTAQVWREAMRQAHFRALENEAMARNQDDTVLDECNCCHELLGLAKLTWTGKQMLCKKCAS